jgi:hypothetical protein
LTEFFRRNTHLFSDDFVRRNELLLANPAETPPTLASPTSPPVSPPTLSSPTSPTATTSPASPPSSVTLSPVRVAESSIDESTDIDEDNIETESFTADSSFETEPFSGPVTENLDSETQDLLQEALAVLQGPSYDRDQPSASQ